MDLTTKQFSVDSDGSTFGQLVEGFDGSTVDGEGQVVGGFGLGDEVEEFSFVGDGDVGQLGGALDEKLHFWICFWFFGLYLIFSENENFFGFEFSVSETFQKPEIKNLLMSQFFDPKTFLNRSNRN